MNKLTKIFFALAVVAAFGASDALAACSTASASSTSPLVRSEATVEALGTVTITCTTGSATGGVQASISITLNPATTVFVNTAATPDNKSTFPIPTLTEAGTALPPPNLLVIGSGTNTLTFTFTPTAAETTLTVSGLRANINASGLPSGATLTASVITGGDISAQANTLIVGIVNAGLRTTGAASTNPTGFASTASTIPFPLNGLTCAAGTSNLQVNIAEGFATSWQVPEADAVAGEGTRFRITVAGVPTGVTVKAPEIINNASAATTGSAPASLTLVRVDGTAADASGGTVLAAPAADTFDTVTLTGGAATIVYEVTATSTAAVENATVILQITTTVGSSTGTITGSVGFGPVGPPTGNAHRPQFAAAGTVTVAVIADCASRIIFSWVVNTAGYDTGIAIANTSEDDDAFGSGSANGATAQTGSCTLTGYPAAGGTPISFTTASIPAGQTLAFTISSVTGFSGFAGYVLANCSFLNGHAFAFVTDGFGSAAGPTLAQGYLGLVVPNGTRGSSAGESLGQ